MSSHAATMAVASRPSSGTDTAPGVSGFGLGNLRARAAAFGGHVDLEAVPDGGAALRLTLPTAAEAPHA